MHPFLDAKASLFCIFLNEGQLLFLNYIKMLTKLKDWIIRTKPEEEILFLQHDDARPYRSLKTKKRVIKFWPNSAAAFAV